MIQDRLKPCVICTSNVDTSKIDTVDSKIMCPKCQHIIENFCSLCTNTTEEKLICPYSLCDRIDELYDLDEAL